MEYSRSSKVGAVELYETFEGSVDEIAELNKALASQKAPMVKENKKSLAELINECPETASIQGSNIELKTELRTELIIEVDGKRIGSILMPNNPTKR